MRDVDVKIFPKIFHHVAGNQTEINLAQFNQALTLLEEHGLNEISGTALAEALFTQFDQDGLRLPLCVMSVSVCV